MEHSATRSGAARTRTAAVRYGVAVLAAAAAVLLRWGLDPWSGNQFPLTTLFGAVAVSVWIGGYRPAILTVLLGYLACDYLFVDPRGQLELTGTQTLVGMVAYGLSCAVIIGLCEALRSAQRRSEGQRRQLELAIAERERAERLTSATLESMTDGFIRFDADWRIVAVNAECVRQVECPRSELLGKIFWELRPAALGTKLETEYRRAVAERVTVHFENHDEPWDRWFESKADPTADGGLAVFTRDITERKRQQVALERSEARLRRVFESNVVGVIRWDLERSLVLDANGEFLRMTGFTRGDVAEGRVNFRELTPPEWTARNEEGIRAIRERGYAAPYEKEYFRKDGSRVPLIIAGTRFDDSPSEGMSFLIDISEAKHAATAMRASEERFRTLAESIPQLAWTARADGHLDWYNRRWYEYTGTTAEQMDGWGWQDVHDPAKLPDVMIRWKASIATGEPFDMVFALRAKDGSFRPFLTRVMPLLDGAGQVTQWFGTNTDIGEQQKVEDALRESEQRFRHLADAMPQIVWTARPDGAIDYMNRRWHELTELADTAGNAGWGEIVHPDDAPESHRRWAEALGNSSLFEMEVRLLDRRHGAYRWHLMRTVPIREAGGGVARWFGTATDIDGQKRAEESSRYLAEASAALASVVDTESTLQKVANLAVPYFADWSAVDVLNPDGSLRRLAVAHLEAAKIRLAHEMMRFYPPDPDAPVGAFAGLRSGKPEMVGAITDEMLVGGAKDERHLGLIRSLGLKSYICVPLIVSGKPLGVLTFVTAESRREYAAADLALAVDLAHRASVAIENTQLYETLRDADRRKDEFLATLAHELRNPLAPIRNALGFIRHSGANGAVEKARAIMERQVTHLVRLVDDLLDVSRITRGKLELRKERIELRAVLDAALEASRPAIEQSGHTLEVSLPDVPIPLEGDSTRLAQVVSNLLNNAAKYTPPGGHIALSAEAEADGALVKVTDDGIGIPPAMLGRVFEMFTQVDRALEKTTGGLGIGLSLVKGLVEAHGGAVEARSEGDGRGSEFIVRLPIAVPEMTVAAAPPAARLDPGRPLRVLVVDDNGDAAETLGQLLELLGHTTRTANDGEEGVAVAEEFRPDVVLMDIGMPRLNGYDAARRIRAQPWGTSMTLVALTGWGQEDDRKKSAAAGFDRHLVKPVEEAALLRVLAESAEVAR